MKYYLLRCGMKRRQRLGSTLYLLPHGNSTVAKARSSQSPLAPKRVPRHTNYSNLCVGVFSNVTVTLRPLWWSGNMTRFVVKRGHSKDTCRNDIGLCA